MWIAGIGLGVYLARGPWVEARKQKAETAFFKAETDTEQKKNMEYQRKRADLESPSGKERALREQGFQKDGEKVVKDLK